MSPLSQEMSTTASIQDVATVAVESSPITPKSNMEESDNTTTTAPFDSATDMKTIAPTELSTTLSVPTTSIVTDNNIEEPVSTAVSIPITLPPTVTSPATLPAMTTSMAMDEHTNEIFKQPDETVSVVETTASPLSQLSTTVAETSISSAVDAMPTKLTETPNIQSLNDLFKLPSETGSIVETTTPRPSQSLPAEVPLSSALDSIMQSLNDVDNVLPLSSNEATTRMGSSTDSKIDNDDKQKDVTPKSQEINNELEAKNGESGCDTIATSFLVSLSMAVLYVIV